MSNNLIINSPTKDTTANNGNRKLEHFYSIYNYGEQSEPPPAQPTAEANSTTQFDNNLSASSKIQLLKLRFNQLNQSSANITNKNANNLKANIDLNKKSSLTSSILPNSYQYQRPNSINSNNKETSIEECKQSLEELLKASKWKDHTNLPARSDSNNHIDPEQINSATQNSEQFAAPNSYKSCLQLRLKTNESTNSTSKLFVF